MQYANSISDPYLLNPTRNRIQPKSELESTLFLYPAEKKISLLIYYNTILLKMVDFEKQYLSPMIKEAIKTYIFHLTNAL